LLGGATLTAGITALLWGLLQGGEAWAWNSPESIAIFAAAVLLLAVFFWQETRAEEPVLPLGLFRNRIIVVGSIAGALSGAALFGVTSYVPLMVQGVEGGTATDAGTVVAPMSMGWPLGSIIAGRLMVRFGYRLATVIGGACLLAGGLLLLLIGDGTPRALLIAMLLLVGLGLGFTSTAFIVSIQNAVPWSQRGVATATNQFFRTIGGTIGVAAMGALLTAQWRSHSADLGAASEFDRANLLLDPARRAELTPELTEIFRRALDQALDSVYLVVAVLSALVFLSVLFFPRGRADELAAADEAQPPAEPEPAVGSAQRGAETQTH
jgi:MFS family permease